LKTAISPSDDGISYAQVPTDAILQKFAFIHAHFHNHFALGRHLVDREIYKQRRSAALAQWQSLAS